MCLGTCSIPSVRHPASWQAACIATPITKPPCLWWACGVIGSFAAPATAIRACLSSGRCSLGTRAPSRLEGSVTQKHAFRRVFHHLLSSMPEFGPMLARDTGRFSFEGPDDPGTRVSARVSSPRPSMPEFGPLLARDTSTFSFEELDDPEMHALACFSITSAGYSFGWQFACNATPLRSRLAFGGPVDRWGASLLLLQLLNELCPDWPA